MEVGLGSTVNAKAKKLLQLSHSGPALAVLSNRFPMLFVRLAELSSWTSFHLQPLFDFTAEKLE